MNTFLAEYHCGLDSKGEELAEAMAPDVAQVIAAAIDEWFAEFTTLSRAEFDDVWAPALNATTLKHLGRKLEALSASHEAVLFETLKRRYREGT